MRSTTLSWKLLGAASTLALGLGIAPAQAASVVLGFGHDAPIDKPMLVADVKGDAGPDAGGSAGAEADADASTGADAGVDAGVDAGADADADAGTDADTGTDAETDTDSGASGGTEAGADGSTEADSTEADSTDADSTDADSTDADSGDADSGDADSGDATGGTSTSDDVGTDVTVGDGSASAPVSPEAPPSDGASAGALPDRPSGSVISGSVRVLPQAVASPNGDPLTGSATVDLPPPASLAGTPPATPCADPAEGAACGIATGAAAPAVQQPRTGATPSGTSGANAGAAKVAASPLAPLARNAAPSSAPPAARAGQGLGISLVDPIRRKDGLLVQGVIVNNGAAAAAIPPMQVSLLNNADQVVQRSTLRLPPETLAQGQNKTFKALVQPLPPNVSRVTVAFIRQTTP